MFFWFQCVNLLKKKMIRRYLCLSIIFINTLLLAACSFHPRNAADIPPQLRILYLKTQQPYNPLITQLKAMLNSLNIKLAPNRAAAPYTLNIIKISFSQSNPPITTTSLAVSFTYVLSVTITIDDASGRALIPPKNLSARRSIARAYASPSSRYCSSLRGAFARRHLIQALRIARIPITRCGAHAVDGIDGTAWRQKSTILSTRA